MKNVLLKEEDINYIMELFAECFFDDPYYVDKFQNIASRKLDMVNAYQSNIEFCVNQKMSYGIKNEAGQLIAFILCFDYQKICYNIETRDSIFGNDKEITEWLKYLNKIIENHNKVIYCLSVAVKKEYRRNGLASGLIDFVINKHNEYCFVSDISNKLSISIYEKRHFKINKIKKEYDYYFVEYSNSLCSIGNKVKLLVPSVEFVKAISKDIVLDFSIINDNVIIVGYDVEIKNGMQYFVFSEKSVRSVVGIELSYDSFLSYQKYINLSHYDEIFLGEYIIYIQFYPYKNLVLYNDLLKEMVKSRKIEWALVPDIFISIPMQYQKSDFNPSLTFDRSDNKIQYLFNVLDYRTNYEAGIPSDLNIINKLDNYSDIDDSTRLKNRIKRLYLGKVEICICEEETFNTFKQNVGIIGQPAYIDIYLTIDKNSNCAVLNLVSLASPFLLSHFMDCVIRNQLNVVDSGKLVNLFSFLKDNYNIVKRGTPKIYVVFPESKDDCGLDESQIASLLAAETIYPDGENMGKIVDSKILDSVNHGIEQYNRASVYAYRNVILQFQPNFRETINHRLEEEAVMLFYMELVLLEESAIKIADYRISYLCSLQDEINTVEFLNQVNEINNEYSKTIDFWNIQVNYATSQESIDNLRKAFKIEEQLQFMKRNQEQMQIVFATRTDIADRKDAKRTNTSLALISILAIFSALIDSYDYVSTWSSIFEKYVISTVQLILSCIIIIIGIYTVYQLFVHHSNKTNKTKEAKGKGKKKN